MNADENKALIQQIYAALEKADSSLFRNHLHPDIRMIVTGQNSWSRTLHGVDSLQQYYRYVYSRLRGPGRLIAERFIADADLVVVEARGDRISIDGERYDNQYCLVYQLADGRIVEMREYMDSSLCERVLGRYPDGSSGS
jgi:ketosteroid isomerase-like protein